MIKMHRHSKYAVILLMFALAIIVGLKTSNLINKINVPKPITHNKMMNEMFEELKYYRKVILRYQATEINMVREDILGSSSGLELRLINSEASGNSYHTLVEVNNNSYKELYDNLVKLTGFQQEKVFNEEKEYDINIEEHINNKKLTKLQLQTLMKHSTIPERVEQYNKQLETIQAQIDSLHNMRSLQEKFKNNSLFYIQINKDVNRSELLINALKKFFIYTFISLIILIIFFVILFFVLDLLLKLMKLMGIKTSGARSSYYYSPKKKKIKRKYKDIKKQENYQDKED